jgi:hypothetical protein
MNTPQPPAQANALTRSAAPPDTTGEIIWSGESADIVIQWTTADLYTRAASGTERIWRPLVQKGFEDFVVLMNGDPSEGERQTIRCSYERRFRLLSVVGTVASFEDQYGDDCGGAHPSSETRFTTVDLSRPGEVRYAREEDTPMMNVDLSNLGKVVKLTDFFSEQDVLRALLADPVVKRALASLNNPVQPKTLAELPELFAGNFYALGDTGFELRPDFLTRFVLHHVEGDQVAVRIGLPPHSGANSTQHQQIGLLLPIPESLRQQLSLADSRQQGFLMVDASRVAGNRTTTFRPRTGDGERGQQ